MDVTSQRMYKTAISPAQLMVHLLLNLKLTLLDLLPLKWSDFVEGRNGCEVICRFRNDLPKRRTLPLHVYDMVQKYQAHQKVSFQLSLNVFQLNYDSMKLRLANLLDATFPDGSITKKSFRRTYCGPVQMVENDEGEIVLSVSAIKPPKLMNCMKV
jgi:hypothetical protein